MAWGTNVYISRSYDIFDKKLQEYKDYKKEEDADKISINSSAVRRPELIDELALQFGSQCVVVAIDTKDFGDKKEESKSFTPLKIDWVGKRKVKIYDMG